LQQETGGLSKGKPPVFLLCFSHDQVATMVKYFLRRMTMEVDYARKGVAGAGLGLGK
jgi:hypothetical protein